MITTVNTSTVNKAKTYQIKEFYSKYRAIPEKNGNENLKRSVVR